jgi:hypothetical protein
MRLRTVGWAADLINLEGLDEDERRLWDEYIAHAPGPRREGPLFEIWSFGFICMFELGRVPDTVHEALEKGDPDNHLLQYWMNVRRARGR